jgi:hypothetical protein
MFSHHDIIDMNFNEFPIGGKQSNKTKKEAGQTKSLCIYSSLIVFVPRKHD